MGLLLHDSPIFGSICTIWYFRYDVVLLRRGGSFFAKLESHHEKVVSKY